MKKNYVICYLLLLTVLQINSQETTSNWMQGWTSFQPNLERYMKADTKIPYIISEDLTLTNDNVYFLSGNVYVVGNAKLTIEPGTLIRCDHENPASLIISRKAKLIAEGNKYNPIIFTSNKSVKARKSGDWGGIIILGNGKLNTAAGVSVVEGNFSPQYSLYGGDNSEEETTVLKYVRIEFPGHKINESKELNGLTLCGIGSKTVIENVMVSYSADDSFEWFGGQGEFKNLISYKSKDDDFDITSGFKGGLTNIVSVRHPYISDVSGSYAIEIDGYAADGFPIEEQLSFLKIKDATLINLANQESTPFIKAAISAKKLAQISVETSSISGFAHVIKIDKTYTNSIEIVNRIQFKNNLFNISEQGLNIPTTTIYEPNNFFISNIFTPNFKNVEDLYMAPLDDEHPSFVLKSSDVKNKFDRSITLNELNK